MPGEKFRVLYVDDEPALLEVGKAFLERSGSISCDTALSPREAIGRLKIEQYDAIISDYQMPDVDGIEFLKFVRKRCGDIPFIIFTGKGREEVVIQALNNGADFYLQKGGDPLSQFAELEHKVKQAVGRFRAEEKLRRINRYNEIVIEVNTVAFRCREKEPFLAEVCRALTRNGDYASAWAGLCDVSGKRLVPVASWDSRGDPSSIGARNPVDIGALESPPLEKVFSGETAYTTLDSLPGLFRSHGDVQRPAAGTPVALVPLFVMGKVRGVLCLSAPRADAFSAEEMAFIGTLGFSVSTAIERMDADEVRRRAEEALADSLRQMQDLIEFLPDPTFAIDNAGRVIAWNRAMEEMTGVGKSAILGRGDHEYARAFYGEKRPMLVDLVAGGDPGAARLYPGARRVGEMVEAEVTRPSPGNGGEVYLWVRAAPLYNRNGERVGAIETVRDITRIKETEKSLLQKNEELAASLEEITAIEEELRQQMEEIARNEQLLRESEERYRAIFEN
ncbi:MAG: response regulator, partial [Methanolinea sp.]